MGRPLSMKRQGSMPEHARCAARRAFSAAHVLHFRILKLHDALAQAASRAVRCFARPKPGRAAPPPPTHDEARRRAASPRPTSSSCSLFIHFVPCSCSCSHVHAHHSCKTPTICSCTHHHVRLTIDRSGSTRFKICSSVHLFSSCSDLFRSVLSSSVPSVCLFVALYNTPSARGRPKAGQLPTTCRRCRCHACSARQPALVRTSLMYHL